MLKLLTSQLFARFGYTIQRLEANAHVGSRYVLHQYLREDGTFDYSAYCEIQAAGNARKIDHVWVQEDNIAFLASYLRQKIKAPQFGICHGTRRGMEQEWFRKYLGCDVIGTEISDTATQFPNTIRWDFHDAKPEWIGAVDFIYSNSLDHSYDPAKCLNVWMSCLRPGGLCFLEHTSEHEPSAASALDPFGVEFEYLPYLISVWAEGKFGVRQILKGPAKPAPNVVINFLVLQPF